MRLITAWQREPLAALAPGKDAVVETSQALANRVIAQQTSPLGTVSGQTHHDDSDPRVASDREGTLAAADTQLVFSAKSWYQIGTVVSTSASGSIVDTNVLGDDVVYIDHTEFTVSFGVLALDLAASSAAGGGVVLLASASVSSKTVSQPVKTITPKGALPYGPLGDLYRQLGMPVGPIVVSAGPAITTGAASASGSIAITAPLRASFDQTTRAIELRADLGAAAVKFSSADASASAITASIEREARAALAGHSLLVMPRLSLVGRLAAAAAASEISISNLDAGVLAASGAHPACVWVAVRLAGTTGTAAAPQNFLAADYAYLCGESVIKAICAYRWRLGDYPTGYLGQPVSDSYKENGTIRAILITPRLVQTDVLDAQGNVVGDIKPMAPQSARQEDFVEIGGHAYSAIDSITHDDATHSPVPAAIRAKYTDSAPFEYRLPVFLSNVGTPATNAVASIDAYFTQMRAGATGHFSRPFAGAPTVALQSRAVNGVDNLLLTQANVTTF